MAQPIHEHVSINQENPKQLAFYWNYGQRWDWLPGKLGRMQAAALARYAKNGSYGYLAARRAQESQPQADHPVVAARKTPPPASAPRWVQARPGR